MRRPFMAMLAACGVLIQPAFARADRCQVIKAERASLESKRASVDFTSAANRQRQELSNARARKQRCDSSSPDRCANLATLVASMEANLAGLEARAKHSGPLDQINARLRALEQQSRSAKCSESDQTAAASRPDNNTPASIGLLAWFGQGVRQSGDAALPAPAATPVSLPPAKARHVDPQRVRRDEPSKAPYTPSRYGGGNFRTVCVRSCDGYFWPVSYQASSRRFSKDAEICQAACPASNVSLYVHRNPGGSIDEAVNLSGRPYTALKTAFRFRKEFDRACTCRTGTPDQQSAFREAWLPLATAEQADEAKAQEHLGSLGLRGSVEASQDEEARRCP